MSGEPARAGARGHRGWWLVALLFAALYLLRAGGEAASFALAHPGDFSHYHRALAALWAGESPFRDPFANQTPALLAALLPLGGLSLAAAR
ncbi:MAG TPA: hypothetical protein VLA75_06620, partial [Thermoanaerobaculia bacterium]|nr:hypothetical protein [Thermoanaerobaculia bacterium]